MARNTERPIPIQEGIEISLAENLLKVSGKNGDLSMSIHPSVMASTPEKELLFSPKEETKESIAMVGTMRALAINMIKGVSDGFEKKLEINGVGYRAKLSGDKLELSLGFSHPVIYQLPEGVNADVPSQTEVILKSANKQLLGETAAKIRSFRPPEPYKGKGVKYAEERGITLVLENHYKDDFWKYPEFAQKKDVFKSLVESINHPSFGVNFDPSNAYLAGEEPLDLLYSISDRVVTMHASDRYLKSGTIDDLKKIDSGKIGYANILSHGEVGKGMNDYDLIFKELKRVGFDNWISIEDGVDGFDQLERSVKFVNEKIREYWT